MSPAFPSPDILAKAHFDRGNLVRARGLFEVCEGLLHDDFNARHLEAISRREETASPKRTLE